MELKENLISGLRLSPGGLHLGHYLGCLTPLDYIDNGEFLYFVIRDGNYKYDKYFYDSDLVKIITDLSSTKYNKRIKFVLHSKLYTQLQVLISYSYDLVTLSQLMNVNPNRSKIKSRKSILSIKDFLFPIDDACTYFLLNGTKILMNDDNHVTVKFARNLSKKINISLKTEFIKPPLLVHGLLPRLLGHNYQKMSKSNNNALFLSDSKVEIDEKLNKLLSFKFYFIKYPELFELRSKHREKFIISKDYLPFQYLNIFSEKSNIIEIIDYYKSYNYFEEFKYFFKDEMNIFFDSLREKRSNLNPNDLLSRLFDDSVDAEQLAKIVLDSFLTLRKT